MIKFVTLFFCFFISSISLVTSTFSAEYIVRRGDTLYQILGDMFTPANIIIINKRIENIFPKFMLKTGQKLLVNEDKVVFQLSLNKDLTLIGNDEEFNLFVTEYPINILETVISGEITSNLYDAIENMGENQELTMKLADIYEWEIDFFKDIRKGDRFRIVVEKKFTKGRFLGYGKICAVDFINNGNLVRALYYEDETTKGYFRPDGSSLKRGFLKAPLKYRRISSKYSHKRLHPVLKVYKPHYGVDYAAPTGTPVHATADGVVVKKGYTKANGNYVKLRHKNNYYTYYLHFSRFKKGLRVGKHVSQGDTIGYVGSTGYSTGPHVDYRIKKNNRFLNPLRFKSTSVKLPERKSSDFREKIVRLERMLDNSIYKMAKFKPLK